MRGLSAKVSKLRAHNFRLAELGAQVFDIGGWQGITPTLLLDSQDALRDELRYVERWLRESRQQAPRRDDLIRSRLHRNPALQALRTQHIALVREAGRVMERRKRILRMLGDAYAWMVLGEPRVLVPLYKGGNHSLTSPLSLSGPRMIARKAVAGGPFHVVENDPTRVLGLGDLTIVPADRGWAIPLALEIKTSGDLLEGTQVEIQAVSYEIEGRVDMEFAQRFCAAAGLGELPVDVMPRDDPEQTAQMLAHAQYLLATTAGLRVRLEGPAPSAWRGVDTVLARALRDGSAWDLREPGVVILGVRATDGRPDRMTYNDLQERLGLVGFNLGAAITSQDFVERSDWSPLARPIALWPIGAGVRAPPSKTSREVGTPHDDRSCASGAPPSF